ncbi:hypothetical protein GV764_02195 [Atlantibacter hermannii]|uniref:hypothetical protein n=1 Tax=Atlantibacter hermannii TaxID=565 RepID=UPI0013776C0B|nr:hypothetical protein [Atlantibacter hermannii]NBC97834.1 hypothetical protein [Atlantibacter hermannii]
MSDKTNDERNKEGEVSKGLPEVAPNAGNAYEEDERQVKDAPNKQGEIPRKRDDSEDDEKDPFKAQ